MISSAPLLAEGTRVRVTTGIGSYGLVGTVVGPAHDDRRPHLRLVRVELRPGGCRTIRTFDVRELEVVS